MKNIYGMHLYSSFDGRTVSAPQMIAMEPKAMAEYLTKCLESGYEAVVSCPIKRLNVKPTLADTLIYTQEKRLRACGHNAYVTELARSLSTQ